MLQIQLQDGRNSFLPGQVVTGTVSWRLPSAPTFAQLQLSWTTRGKGTVDSEIVRTVEFPDPEAIAQLPFSLPLPEAPYSFSGKLVSLVWSLRLYLKPSGEEIILPLTISPTGSEIILQRGGGGAR